MEGQTPPPGILIKKFPFLSRLHTIMRHMMSEIARGSGLDCSEEEARRDIKQTYIDMVYDLLPDHCESNGCSLHSSHEWGDPVGGLIIPRIIPGVGNADADVVFIGEGPGCGERNTYTPLVGPEEVIASRCVECTKFKECFKTLI